MTPLHGFFAFLVAQLNATAVHGAHSDGSLDDEDLWTEIFQNASQLRTVVVEIIYFSEFKVRALHPRNGVIPAPNLVDITLGEIHFDRCCCSCEGERDHAGVGDIQCLLHALAKRAEAGNTLPRLDLSGCSNITGDEVMELSKVVGRIEYPHTRLGVEF